MDLIDLAAHRLVHESALKPKEIAEAVGVKYQVMMNKVCPTNEDAELTLHQGFAIMKLLGRRDIIDAMSQMLGETEPKGAKGIFEAVLEAQIEHADVARAIHHAMADQRINDREASAILREIDEAIGALEQVRESVLSENKTLLRAAK